MKGRLENGSQSYFWGSKELVAQAASTEAADDCLNMLQDLSIPLLI
jgi:hypothetical protein